MHLRSGIRCRAWQTGTAVLAGGSLFIPPAFGALSISVAAGVVAASGAVLFVNAVRPRSDFYVKFNRHGPRSQQRVALTFDDGPDPIRTPQVLEALHSEGARATFFMIGRRALAQPELVRQVVQAGHEIGCHSLTHPRTMNFRSASGVRREIEDGVKALRDAGAGDVRWYRPPMGFSTPALRRAMEASPLQLVNWSLHSHDLARRDEESIVSTVASQASGGDVILMHDGVDLGGPGPEAVPGAVRRLLPMLRSRGLRACTLSEVMEARS